MRAVVEPEMLDGLRELKLRRLPGRLPRAACSHPAVASWFVPSRLADEPLLRALERARDLGFLGPGPVVDHLDHARAYLPALPPQGAGGVVVDLGTGGGVPGVPLAYWRPDLTWVLVDAMVKRASFVQTVVDELRLTATVLESRAEAMALQAPWQHNCDVVVARSLAAPGIAAEYAAPLLKPGGHAVIAEPPGGNPDRWPADGLALLGMRPGAILSAPQATLQVLEQVESAAVRQVQVSAVKQSGERFVLGGQRKGVGVAQVHRRRTTSGGQKGVDRGVGVECVDSDPADLHGVVAHGQPTSERRIPRRFA